MVQIEPLSKTCLLSTNVCRNFLSFLTINHVNTMQNQKYYTNNLILNVQVNVILLKLSTVGVKMYSQIKNCKPMYSLSIYHKFCCNTVEYMYIYAFLIRDKRILKQTNKSAFSRKYNATILQRRLNFSYAQCNSSALYVAIRSKPWNVNVWGT